jgi:small-conductance mechanosensitive channel
MTWTLQTIGDNPYSSALIILIAGVLAAFILELTIVKVLFSLTRRTRTVFDDLIIRALRRPLFISLVLASLDLALHRLALHEKLIRTIEALLFTAALLLWTWVAIRLGKVLLNGISQRAGEHKFVQTRTLPLFHIVLKTVAIGGAVYGFLVTWNINVTAWLASAGIIGIAVGFAAKDTLANLFSGIFILADAPYKIGDFIVLDSGERGQVTDIGIRSTRILTRDDIQIVIPNATIGNAKIVNESGGPYEKHRVRIDVGVAYGSDIDRVRQVLLRVAGDCKHLARDPLPRVRFREFGDSALKFQLLAWIDEPRLRGQAIDDLNTNIYKSFQKEGLEIPFPQRDVHIRQT